MDSYHPYLEVAIGSNINAGEYGRFCLAVSFMKGVVPIVSNILCFVTDFFIWDEICL